MSRKPAEDMNERELLLAIHEDVQALSSRVEKIEQSNLNRDRDWTITMHYMHSLNLAMGRKAEADELLAVIDDRHGGNGASKVTDDVPTSPTNEAPEPPA